MLMSCIIIDKLCHISSPSGDYSCITWVLDCWFPKMETWQMTRRSLLNTQSFYGRNLIIIIRENRRKYNWTLRINRPLHYIEDRYNDLLSRLTNYSLPVTKFIRYKAFQSTCLTLNIDSWHVVVWHDWWRSIYIEVGRFESSLII